MSCPRMLRQAKCTMADGNIARWDEGSWKTWDETEECGVPEDAFYCAVRAPRQTAHASFAATAVQRARAQGPPRAATNSVPCSALARAMCASALLAQGWHACSLCPLLLARDACRGVATHSHTHAHAYTRTHHTAHRTYARPHARRGTHARAHTPGLPLAGLHRPACPNGKDCAQVRLNSSCEGEGGAKRIAHRNETG